MFMTLMCRCEMGHEWQMLVPNYWTATQDCCPECQKDIAQIKAGDPMTFEQVQAALKEQAGG